MMDDINVDDTSNTSTRPSRSCKSTYRNKTRAQSCSVLNLDKTFSKLDQEGHELVQMIKDKLTIASPPPAPELQVPPTIATAEVPVEQPTPQQLSPPTPIPGAEGVCYAHQTPNNIVNTPHGSEGSAPSMFDWHAASTNQAASPPPSESPTAELFSLMMSGFQRTISSILQQQQAMQQESIRQQQTFQRDIHLQMIELFKHTRPADAATSLPMPVAATTPAVSPPSAVIVVPTTPATATYTCIYIDICVFVKSDSRVFL